MRIMNGTNGIGTVKEEHRFRVRWHQIVQYLDDSLGHNGYTTNDTVCKTYEIGSSPFTFSTGVRTTDALGNNITQFTGSSADGILILRVTLSGNDLGSKPKEIKKDGRDIIPTSVKIDVEINGTLFNYNTTGDCGSQSYLAVVARVKSRSQLKTRDENGETVINSWAVGADAEPTGFFSWATLAAVNGTSTNVGVLFNEVDLPSDGDTEAGETQKAASYSFNSNNPTFVAWDPEFGYDLSAGFSVRTSMAMLMALVLLAFGFISQQ
jgi:hypothetical protein